MDAIHEIVRAAIENDIYIILDWHCHEPRTAEAEGFFREFASTWASSENIIYELWNEPLGIYGWDEHILPHHRQTSEAIRQHDEASLILAGTPNWCQRVDEPTRAPLSDNNVAYALHYYAATHRRRLRCRSSKALAGGAPLFVSEWGASEASGDGRLDLVECQRWERFLNRHGLSDVAWSVTDKAESSAILRRGASRTGGWSEADLTQSGRYLRSRLRALSGANPG